MTMKKQFLALLLAVTCLNAIPVFAQPKTAPLWSVDLQYVINWQRVHSLGYLIVGSGKALHCIHPQDGKILWQHEAFADVKAANFKEVEGTEFIAISYGEESDGTLPMQAIIEVESGRILFDSQKETIGVLSLHVLPKSGKLLLIGARPGAMAASLFMYDIASGKRLWANDELFKSDGGGAKGLLGKMQALSQQMESFRSLTSEPVELDDNSVIFTHPNYVMRINAGNGEVIWKNSIESSVRAQVRFSPYQKGVVFVGVEVESSTGMTMTTTTGNAQDRKIYQNWYYAFDINSGNSLWKQPAKENDGLNVMIMHEKGIIVCPRSEQKPTINLVDYVTGKMQWGKNGKGVKVEGSVVSYLPTEKGFMITTAFHNKWNSLIDEYYLNILDPETGTLRLAKPIKLKGDLVRSEIVPKGLLFVTTREINILDLNTGSLVWDAHIESGGPRTGEVRPFPVGVKDDKLYVFSPKESALFEVDKNAGTFRKLTNTKIKFEGDELPSAIDVYDDGIVLYSQQNIIKLGFDGMPKYAKYYPAPRQPALMRALLVAQAIQGAYYGVAASAYSAAAAQAAAQTSDPVGKELGGEISSTMAQLGAQGFNYSANAMKTFSARFKASRAATDFVMMMTRQEKRGNQLIQVSKADGEILSAIDIKNDKEPEYDIDQVINHVYYRPNVSTIVCYKL